MHWDDDAFDKNIKENVGIYKTEEEAQEKLEEIQRILKDGGYYED